MWTSTKDILPDPHKNVLCCDARFESACYYVAYLSSCRGYWVDSEDMECPYPCYWMPIPDLPLIHTSHNAI